MHMKAKEDHELLDLVSIWTFELLDNSISLENYFQLENTLLHFSQARESFVRSVKMHDELIGMFDDAPAYLRAGLQRAAGLVEFVEGQTEREKSLSA